MSDRKKGSGKEAWPPPGLNIADKLGLVKFKPDDNSHLRVLDPEVCRTRCPQKFCTHACPAQVYRWEPDDELISIAFEGCLECGTCRSGGCPFSNIEMHYPRGGFGVQYRFG
jgi:ferredoxin like protein